MRDWTVPARISTQKQWSPGAAIRISALCGSRAIRLPVPVPPPPGKRGLWHAQRQPLWHVAHPRLRGGTDHYLVFEMRSDRDTTPPDDVALLGEVSIAAKWQGGRWNFIEAYLTKAIVATLSDMVGDWVLPRLCPGRLPAAVRLADATRLQVWVRL